MRKDIVIIEPVFESTDSSSLKLAEGTLRSIDYAKSLGSKIELWIVYQEDVSEVDLETYLKEDLAYPVEGGVAKVEKDGNIEELLIDKIGEEFHVVLSSTWSMLFSGYL